MVILKAMAEIFVSVVCIVIAASIFTEGIKALKGIEHLALAVSSMGGGFRCVAYYYSFKLYCVFCKCNYG